MKSEGSSTSANSLLVNSGQTANLMYFNGSRIRLVPCGFLNAAIVEKTARCGQMALGKHILHTNPVVDSRLIFR